MRGFLRELIGPERFTVQPLTGESSHEYRLHRDGVTILFDHAFVDDYGTAHLYADGSVVSTVRTDLIPDISEAEGSR